MAAGYTGRFAPSPTGPLHAGSLLSATASYLQARKHNGRWLVRIEDIDPPREVSGASDDILRTLERFGFEWDGEVRFQSTRLDNYRARLADVDDLTYYCTCSRRDIASATQGCSVPQGYYPRLCRDKDRSPPGALRIRFDQPSVFNDPLQGTVHPAQSTDDFIIWRKDNLPSYQWAVSVDDAEQDITEIVRGSDLLDTTARQIFLLQALGATVPSFMHVPVLINEERQKLSKQTGAQALLPGNETTQLCATFSQLGLPVCDAPIASDVADLWLWAIRQWNPKPLIGKETIPFVKP
ncbi:MAG: tRNA glutamyl-Q(34) synthetase GluQRS [Gammaproteobacteria bacterium]